MGKHINTILVPVDFSGNSELAISKALEFCQEGNSSTIHLFHAHRIMSSGISDFFSRLFNGVTKKQLRSDVQDATSRLDSLKLEIEKEREDVKVVCSVVFGDSVQEGIVKKAVHLGADLIVIGKRSHHSVLPFLNTIIPSKLAMASGVPVLTVKQGSFHQKIKTIVIPISRQSPISKLEILPMLGKRFRPQIRLVIFEDDNSENEGSRQMLLDALRRLKSQSLSIVNYEVLKGGNKARALLEYCHKVGADVLIVYPGSETRVGNWLNSHISDLVPSGSRTQILAMTPG